MPDLGQTFLPDPPHGWNDGHAAWSGGRYDQWVPNKGVTTMTYHTRTDLPYQYALADAFTVCDNYFCSLMGPTDPNRYHMWTGWVDEVALVFHNSGATSVRVSVVDRYTGRVTTASIRAGRSAAKRWNLSRTRGWYDLFVTLDGDPHLEQRYAGHLENGRDSITDPAMAGLI